MARKAVYRISTQHGWLDDYPTRKAAVKALSKAVAIAADNCRIDFKRCSVVGSAAKGDVTIRIGGRQGFNIWNRYVINKKSSLGGLSTRKKRRRRKRR